MTAIVFMRATPGVSPKKYHNIAKSKEQKFLDWVRNFWPDARYVNFYERSNREFIKRRYI